MTIASKLETINEALGDIKSSIVAKGVTPTGNITTYSTAIESISTGDEITATNTTGSAVSADDRVWVEPESAEVRDFTVVGSPTINDTTKTITNFSGSNYITIPAIDTQTANTWEIVLKTNFSSSIAYYQYFVRSQSLQIFSGLGAGGLGMRYTANGTQYTSPATAYAMGGNGIKYIKVVYDGTNYKGFVSQDGENWNEHFSFEGQKADYVTSNVLNIGSDGQSYFIAGTLYTNNETYIKVNGVTVWTPYKEAVVGYSIINDTDITSTSFTGIAQEAIANNATGSVKTLLDGNGTYAPTTATKSITTNGTYTASAENAYGLSEVTVNVPTPDVWHNWKTEASANISSITLPFSCSYPQLVYGNNTYFLTTRDALTGAISTDGINWSQISLPNGVFSGDIYWTQAIFDGTRFILASTLANSYWFYTTDFTNWVQISPANNHVLSYANNIYYKTYVAGETDLYYTTTDITVSTSTSYFPQAGIWSGVKELNGNVLVYGQYTKNGSTQYAYMVSTTGTGSWVLYDVDFDAQTIMYGNGVYTVLYNNQCYYSTDLINWQTKELPATGTWRPIIFGGDMFISGQSNGSNLLYSEDGINWKLASITQNTYYSACYDGSTFVSAGNSASGNKITLSQSQCYTLTASPTTSTQVYEIPKKTSALTITAVGTGTITLSDSKVYNRNSAGDVESPVLGTKTITSNDTYTAASDYLDGFSSVTVDVPSAPTKKYNLLDRVTDDSNNEIGTVSGFFTDANNVEYAVVCLDAQYRLEQGTYCSDAIHVITGLPVYEGITDWGPWEAKETATFNTQKIIDYCSSSGATSTACSHCRSKSFTIDGTTYYGQLPNMIELNDIIRNHTALDTADPTASSYSSVNFISDISIGWWSSSQSVGPAAWCGYAGSFYADDKDMKEGAVPVLEIPNT